MQKIQTLAELLTIARNLGLSDVHLHTNEVPWIRRAGQLIRWEGMDIISRDDMRRFMRETGSESASSMDTSYERAFQIPGVGRVRATWYLSHRERAGSLRLLPEKIPTSFELNLPSAINDLAKIPSGLILVTGSTGSGKSTVLASVIDQINHLRACHILTIEQPIEYQHKSIKSLVSQIEVGVDVPNWEVAIKMALRQDPDILLLGEIRDALSANAALQAAATGHLVLATLHSDSPYIALDRFNALLGLTSSQKILAQTLEAIVGCRLLTDKAKQHVLPIIELVRFDKAHREAIANNTPYPTSRAPGSLSANDQLEYWEKLGRL